MTETTQIPFCGGIMDRAEDRRSPDELAAFMNTPKAQAIFLHHGRPALHPDMRLVFADLSQALQMNSVDPSPIFLGLDKQGPIFAVSLTAPNEFLPEDMFGELRMMGARMEVGELALSGYARSLFDWHRTHRFCANCGAASHSADGGLKRICPSCETEHFPRVNPVAIMLILKGESCLMGRGHGWPDGFYSALAGFVSPGESLEECCIREVKEEVGLDVHSPHYIFSQPWPYPGQLMMGLTCQTDGEDFTVNEAELETARWFTRQEVQDVLNKKSEAFFAPPRTAIAHHLLRHWAFS